MTEPNLAARGTRIGAIGSALQSTDTRLSTVIDGIKGVLADESWREFVTSRGDHVQHERFVDFVTTPMLRGLGVTVDLVRRVVADDPETRDLLDKALQERGGGYREIVLTDSNINSENDLEKTVGTAGRPVGTTQEQALRRLRKEADAGNEQAAELRAEVLAGNLTAHAAMVRAGYRPRAVSVPVSRPDSVASTLRKHMTPEDLARLIALLVQEPTSE